MRDGKNSAGEGSRGGLRVTVLMIQYFMPSPVTPHVFTETPHVFTETRVNVRETIPDKELEE